MKDTLPEISIRLKCNIINSDVAVCSEFLFDDKTIENIEHYSSISLFHGAGSECSYSLNDSLLYIDKDICLDTKEGRCYKLSLHPYHLIAKHPDQVESTLFLLRRNNCKVVAFQYLKRIMKENIEIFKVSELFSIISGFYKIAALEKKMRKNILPVKQDAFPRKFSSNSESDFKIEEGMTILLQSDVFSMLFQPLFEENRINLVYLEHCVLSYMRALMNQDIQVQQNLQLLLARIIIKTNDFEKLKQLLQYHILSDSLEMVTLLINIATQFPMAFYLAIDMMFRLKSFDKLIDALIEKNYMLEALQVMNYKNASKLDIMKIIAKCQEGGDEQMISTLTVMIKEWALLNGN